MTDPDLVLLAGDWHGNTGWARHVINMAGYRFPEGPLILHVGDFGFWPGPAAARYLDAVTEALAAIDGELWFVDGNHEWHPELHRLYEKDRERFRGTGVVPVSRDSTGTQRVGWLPRGHRWNWHGKTWLALGGAVSVDRAVRTEGENWWPEEVIGDEDVFTAISLDRADVMLCHDAPTEVRMTFAQPPSFWDAADLARADAHREKLQRVVDVMNPELLIHGHYHRPVRQQLVKGGRRIIGLDTDGVGENWTLLDTRELKEIM